MTETILKLVAVALLLSPLAVASIKDSAVEAILTKVIQAGFAISSAAGLVLLVVQLAVVLLRSVFSMSFIWLQESTLYLFGAMFLLSSGALLLSEGHVRVDIFYNNISTRMKAYVDLAGLSLLVLPLTILIIWVSWSYVGTSWVQMERSQEATGIHAVFLLKSMIPTFAVLLALAAEVRIIQIFRQLREAR